MEREDCPLNEAFPENFTTLVGLRERMSWVSLIVGLKRANVLGFSDCRSKESECHGFLYNKESECHGFL